MLENTINDDKTIAGGIGTMLAGRYHILRQLGKGGMGSVWLAEDRQLDNRKVAIKMLPSIVVTDKRAYQQLKSEALVSLKLVHPNIVTLRAFEENNGAPFLVMDYIEGQTLSDYLAVKGKLSETETIKLLKPIAAALDYAHGEKVIHRDVKPSNIIIRKDGHPFILDFGIAREIQESMTRVTGRTISGTLLYMSPEQLRGAPPAPAQDVYSFAAMCYECLKGEPPFTRGEIDYQILNENPMALMGRTQLVVAIMTGLAKRPENRPSNCSAFFYAGDAIPSSHRFLSKILILCGFLVLCGSFGYIIYQSHVDRKTKGIYVRNACERTPVIRTFLSEMAWSFYDDDYYKHSTAERRVQDDREKTSRDFVGWNISFSGGADWADTNMTHIAQREFSKVNDCFLSGDFTSGEYWLKRSTQKDNSVYQFYRGVLAEHKGNIKESHRWYQLSAEDWCKEALFNLGVFYECGIGVKSDSKLASGYYQRAALMGDQEAQRRFEVVTKQAFSIPENGLIPVFLRKPWPDSSVLVKGAEFAALRDDVGRWWDVPFSKVKEFFKVNANQVDGKFFFVEDSNDGKTINHYEIRRDRIQDFDTENRFQAVERWNGEEMQFLKANDVQSARNMVLYYILITGKDEFAKMNSGKKFEAVAPNDIFISDDGVGIMTLWLTAGN